MKKRFTLFVTLALVATLALPTFAAKGVAVLPAATSPVSTITLPEVKALPTDMLSMGIDQFLKLTPSKYKEITGKKLGIKKSIELKAAQKMVKKHMGNGAADISKGLYIVLAIFGLGWLAMGLMDDWSGNDWIINLILTVLCWLPGLIHAFIKMNKYYK